MAMLPERVLSDRISSPAVFAGDDACLTLGLLAGLRSVQTGQPLLIVDGANAFDPFLVADLARKSGLLPQSLLDEIRISRVFTCHQLEALLRGRLQMAVRRFRSKAVYFSGLLDPLLDEEVPYKEAARIFQLIPPILQRLAASGIVALCACPGLSTVEGPALSAAEGPPPQSIPGREGLFPMLCETAAWVFQVARVTRRVVGLHAGHASHPERQRGISNDEAFQITCTKPMASSWTWEPQIGMVTPRRWW